MTKLIVFIIFFYLAYKFIFDFAIPLGKASTQIKSKIREMQANQAENESQPVKQTAPTKASGDYIDYEEVK